MNTVQKQASFKEQLSFGEEGEHEVAQWLITKGVSVLPLYQFNPENTPCIYHMQGKTTSPDLVCFKNDSFMVEVKTKNQWVRFGDRIETGLNLKHYKHYEKIELLTNKKVYVFFNHKVERPTGFYFVPLKAYTREWDGKVNGNVVYDKMIFYNINVLKKLL